MRRSASSSIAPCRAPARIAGGIGHETTRLRTVVFVAGAGGFQRKAVERIQHEGAVGFVQALFGVPHRPAGGVVDELRNTLLSAIAAAISSAISSILVGSDLIVVASSDSMAPVSRTLPADAVIQPAAVSHFMYPSRSPSVAPSLQCDLIQVNWSGDESVTDDCRRMAVFAQVVEHNGFTAAARRLKVPEGAGESRGGRTGARTGRAPAGAHDASHRPDRRRPVHPRALPARGAGSRSRPRSAAAGGRGRAAARRHRPGLRPPAGGTAWCRASWNAFRR